MARIRKPLNKSAILFLAFIAIGLVVAVVLHFVGMIDLSFVGDWATGAGMAMSESAYVAGGVIIGLIFAGILLGFWLKDYIIGVDTTGATITQNVTTSGGYNPAPTVPTQTPGNANTVS